MAIFTVKFDCGNAAFADDVDGEIVRILRAIADKVERQGCTGFSEPVRDLNGNTVGAFVLSVTK